MTGYRLHGLNIRSEIDLAEARGLRGDEEPDLVIERAPDALRRPEGADLVGGPVDPARPFYELFEDDGGWTFLLPDAGFSARIGRDLRRVRVHAAARHEQLAPLLVAGALLGLLLDLRGDVAMHASAIEVDGAAIAFTGPSGSGKTTVAAVACAAGAPLITDDVLRIEVGRRPPVCHRGATALRLRPHVAALAATPRALATAGTIDGRVALHLPATERDELPLRAVIVPRPTRGAAELVLERLPRPRALAVLASSGRYVGWRSRDGRAAQFHRAATLEEHVPVLAATVPWTDPVSPALGPLLLDRLRTA
ncbi:MAG TPA: hypothetical protein VHF89_13050 [Solirubrobacteraceae bacterium]|nr:hypothetical protein [Solirubrobacteraceae bacterium]